MVDDTPKAGRKMKATAVDYLGIEHKDVSKIKAGECIFPFNYKKTDGKYTKHPDPPGSFDCIPYVNDPKLGLVCATEVTGSESKGAKGRTAKWGFCPIDELNEKEQEIFREKYKIEERIPETPLEISVESSFEDWYGPLKNYTFMNEKPFKAEGDYKKNYPTINFAITKSKDDDNVKAIVKTPIGKTKKVFKYKLRGDGKPTKKVVPIKNGDSVEKQEEVWIKMKYFDESKFREMQKQNTSIASVDMDPDDISIPGWVGPDVGTFKNLAPFKAEGDYKKNYPTLSFAARKAHGDDNVKAIVKTPYKSKKVYKLRGDSNPTKKVKPLKDASSIKKGEKVWIKKQFYDSA